ncbi:sodium:proton antiporter [Photobacterium proteolyticum]|uniref:Sodium:proton antiporter n=1 Tax=Photobacterium proteolyticum TaxID=1903952 RepID=A0A1Q9GSU1_9GAMM|nr:Na+/H+ antiporter NhaC family protein [Photobacterium proteolyticum]OLQ77773.1 sodium:proton antiporter [Photobacterium proteolyticum]
MDSWLTLLPPCISILLAMTTRQVYVAIFTGIMAGSILLAQTVIGGIADSFNAIAVTFSSPSSVKSLIFIVMIGAIINVMQQSGGVEALIHQLSRQRGPVRTKVSAQLVTFGFGFLMCLEGVGSMMLVGVVGRPLFKQFEISNERLALVANCTGAPLAWLVPFSGAGVFLTSLIASEVEKGMLSEQPASYVLSALPYQFYTIVILALVPLLALLKKERLVANTGETVIVDNENMKSRVAAHSSATAFYLLVPIVLLITPIGLITYMTDDISSAVYLSGFISLIGSGVYFRANMVSVEQYIDWCLQGMKNMLPAAIILILAFSLSRVSGELGTGKYLATLFAGELPLGLVPVAIFVLCILISFSTGSSGATVSIMTSIVVSLAVSTGTSVPLCIAAMISGAVFGDQSSPISDSVIVASSAADCPPEKHFATQLPYTLAVALLSLAFYLVVGLSA